MLGDTNHEEEELHNDNREIAQEESNLAPYKF